MKVAKVNKAECTICGDIMVSKRRHDFITCGCGKSFVDGGDIDHDGGWYVRMGGSAYWIGEEIDIEEEYCNSMAENGK